MHFKRFVLSKVPQSSLYNPGGSFLNREGCSELAGVKLWKENWPTPQIGCQIFKENEKKVSPGVQVAL